MTPTVEIPAVAVGVALGIGLARLADTGVTRLAARLYRHRFGPPSGDVGCTRRRCPCRWGRR